MNIIYVIIFISSYRVGLEIFRNLWQRQAWLPEFERSTNVAIGQSERGLIYHNFKKFAHMVIAGTTGYGKTNLIKCLISQLKGEVILIDLKGGFDYDEIITAGNIVEARIELERVVSIMRSKRQEHIFVIVDEAYELVPPDHLTKKEASDYYECLHYISEIARLGRAFKVHLIYATQYPTREVLNGQIKQNAETRIVFRLPTEIASRVALDEAGAEELPTGHYGLGIYKRDVNMQVKTFEFYERVGWNEKVRTQEIEGTENNFIL